MRINAVSTRFLATRYLMRHQWTYRCCISNSSFQPPDAPPPFHGVSVFPNIDLHLATTKTINQDPNSVSFITGSSRGIGLELCRQLLTETPASTVLAGCRAVSPALQKLHEQFPRRLQPITNLHLEDSESIKTTVHHIRQRHDRLDQLWNVAALLGDTKSTPGPERTLQQLDPGWLLQSFQVNAVAPLLLSKELLPLLQASGFDRYQTPIVVNISARVGSIADNHSQGGWYSYRMSKAALNQAVRTLAIELNRKAKNAPVHTIALHPGTTETDLSRPFSRNVAAGRLFPVAFSVQQLRKVVDLVAAEHSGGFYDWSGQALPF